MTLRELSLGPGWYPRQRDKIEEFLKPVLESGDFRSQDAFSAVAPHAGWYYSGLTAAIAVSSLDTRVETVAVIGGHLPKGMPVLVAQEEGVKTPLGIMEIDRELRKEFEGQLDIRPDNYNDNTVEVLIPMVHYFFPQAKLLWLRFPAELSSFEAGKILSKTAAAIGRQVAVIASTDLTHYGDNYGFCPKGRGKPALEWVKKVNDAAFITAVLEGEPSLVLKRAEEDYSACSAGAVLGALGFAASRKGKSKLLDYRTSADAGQNSGDSREEIPDSFVGYAAISLG